MSVELNRTLFNSRLRSLIDSWSNAGKNDDYSSVADCDALLILAGDPAAEDEAPKKSTAFQTWLLGYEFPTTFIMVQKDRMYMLCSPKKAKILGQVQNADNPVPVEVVVMEKGAAAITAITTLAQHYGAHKRVGHLAKDVHTGKIMDDWTAAVNDLTDKPELVDMAPALSAVMCPKDEEELRAIRVASNLTSTLLAHYIAPKLETILDRETKLTHEVFSAQIEGRLGSGDKGPDMKVWGKAKGLNNIDWPSSEFCYPPIIQSRSSRSGYDIRSSAESTTDDMSHQGVLLVAVGMRYKGYAANVGRTFIVDPTKEQEAIYKSLLAMQESVLGVMVNGAEAKDVYHHAVETLHKKHPELEKHFPKNVGFAMGLEFRDSAYVLNAKNTRILKADMVFNLALGLEGLDDGNGKKYSLLLSDTVKIARDRAVLLTDGYKATKETLFFINQDEKPAQKTTKEKAPAKAKVNASPMKNKTAGGKVLRTKTRSAVQDEVTQNTSSKILEHQRELFEARQRDGVAKYSEEGDGAGKNEGKQWKRFNSYKGDAALPAEVEHLRIVIDRKALTVVLPINGFAVPFHINTIKNVSKTDENEYTLLRVNFQTPGQLTGKKEDTPFEDHDATFIRSVSYRSTDGHRFDSLAKQINDLKKELNKREQQKKQMADVIEQDRLQEIKGRRPVKLAETFVRPALDGKRLPGEVEIHQNGLRYTSPGSSHKIDVLFSNIKHLFFQPCDYELLVIIHIHLKAPILVGKKKAHDIQFYREASDVQFDETGNRKRKYRYGDEDEIEMEQQERKRRQILNRDFKDYAEKIADAASQYISEPLELDIPFRELSFEGVPFRTNVRLHPTTDCLVHLSDPPFMVVTLNEIEVASLERVQFSLKQFDMVLIFRDFTKTPMHVNSIPTSQLDDVKNWLDSCDIPLGEGPVNLNWGSIMKTINENPYEFFREGGWRSFLGSGGAQSDNESESDEESEYSQEEESEEEDAYSDSESDFSDGNASDDSGSGFDDDGSSEEADDWDELERKAAKSDKKRLDENRRTGNMDDSDEEDRPKKKKPAAKPANGKSNGKANGKTRR